MDKYECEGQIDIFSFKRYFGLDVGDTVRCANSREARRLADDLEKEGYRVTYGNFGTGNANVLTITKTPKEGA